jgi:hypothetical protein
MSAKAIKRIVYGVVAAVLLVVAGREMLAAGLSPETAMAGGLGLVFGFMAVTGAG